MRSAFTFRTAAVALAMTLAGLPQMAGATVTVDANGASVEGPELTAAARARAPIGKAATGQAVTVIAAKGATNLRKSAGTITVIGAESGR